jgi:hypothetical protein
VRLSTWCQMVLLMAPIFGAVVLAVRVAVIVSVADTPGPAPGRRGGSSSSVVCDDLLTLDVPNGLAALLLAA